MVGIGENYLPAFVLALTASQVACGLTPTIPQVLGAILQLGTPYFLDRFRSYRRWVVLCAAIQAAVFLPLSAAALTGSMSTVAALVVISLYWATGLAGGPAWNTWVATLIPERLRARYLARRSRIAQGGFLAGDFCLAAWCFKPGPHGLEPCCRSLCCFSWWLPAGLPRPYSLRSRENPCASISKPSAFRISRGFRSRSSMETTAWYSFTCSCAGVRTDFLAVFHPLHALST